MKESPKRYINPFLSDEENDKVNLWNDDKVNFTTKLEDEKLGKSLAPPNAPSEYIDKNVTECKLPELITCYEESGFNVVKDICVDEGLSHGEKIGCDKEHHKLSCDPVSVNADKHDALIEDVLGTQFSKQEMQVISSPLADCYKDDELKLLGDSNIVQSSENFGPEKSMQNDKRELDSSSISVNNLKPSNNDVNDISQQLRESQTEADISNETKIEENITPNSDNVKPETVSGPRELPLDTQSAPNHHDKGPDNVTVAVNQLQHGVGESSFSMAGPVSGLITFSGPISSAGSISHRSDGSNTSVRSFAFPILQNEWNSSPVRMAKADSSRSRKHHGWKQALMCCRF